MRNIPAIRVESLHKDFKLPHEKHTSIKGALISKTKGSKAKFEQQNVLKGLSFTVDKGDFFGIVGRNGSGKSTLLKILAGIYEPTRGRVEVNGRLTPFIELGVGFNPELTGRENVFLNGALLGFNRKQMQGMYKDIVEFAELDKFMDQKLKNYSSGMQVRLAFSIAIQAKSDILLLDEVLAVGDADFQRKCYDYFMSLKEQGQTVVLVTHDMGAVRQYCNNAIMIEKGKIVCQGDPESVAQEYHKLFSTNQTQEKDEPKKAEDSWGEGGIKVLNTSVRVSDRLITIRAKYGVNSNLGPPIYGFTLYNSAGTDILEANTRKERVKTSSIKKNDIIQIEWEIPNILSDGQYTVSVAACDQSASHFYVWQNKAAKFRVTKDIMTAGVVNPEIRTSIKGGL